MPLKLQISNNRRLASRFASQYTLSDFSEIFIVTKFSFFSAGDYSQPAKYENNPPNNYHPIRLSKEDVKAIFRLGSDRSLGLKKEYSLRKRVATTAKDVRRQSMKWKWIRRHEVLHRNRPGVSGGYAIAFDDRPFNCTLGVRERIVHHEGVVRQLTST